MANYRIQAQVLRVNEVKRQRWTVTEQVPSFVLEGDVLGLTSVKSAKIAATRMLYTLARPTVLSVHVDAEEV